MNKSDFWKPVDFEDAKVAFESKDYLVVVTPAEWRAQGKEVDRTLAEFSVVNKVYGTVEAGMNALASAIITAQTLQETLDDLTKSREVTNGNVVGFPGKNRPE